jgi:hypothetical protein
VPSNSKRVVVVHRAVKQHNVHAESSDSRPNVGIGSNSEVEQDDNELLEHDACAGWKHVRALPSFRNAC